ncbi:MAG: GNAT family N-acetyltransferase [Candidatus Heimdallarchaeota archaeon]|nr:GNAT family N-acetyltransferase [Candidatus Heimdallarchaeota archaeon]
MKIRLIRKQEQKLIDKCREIAQKNYLDNLVLIGDLYFPCINLTNIYGLFSQNNKLLSFFTVFRGFKELSVVLPVKLKSQLLAKIMAFLQENLPQQFSLVSLELKEKNLSDFFNITGFTSEYCMKIERKNTPRALPFSFLKKVREEDQERIESFYTTVGAYAWNEIQLESGFYYYIELNDQIVACGGTHFETPSLAQLGNIYVLKEFRRQKLGTILTTNITHDILAKKKLATLFVFQDNLPALHLYKKLGFEIYKPVHIFFCEKL